MELSEIVNKLKESDIGAEIVSAVKALDKSAEIDRLNKEIESERGKASGILEDKKKYKERAEKAESEIKKIADSKLPEDERRQKELDELNEKLKQAEAERQADADKFAKTQRDAKVSELTNSIKWGSGTPFSTAKLIVSNALNEIDDLNDESKVSDTLQKIAESHKSFISADAPSGTGGKGNKEFGGDGVNESKEYSIADNQKAIWGNK